MSDLAWVLQPLRNDKGPTSVLLRLQIASELLGTQEAPF